MQLFVLSKEPAIAPRYLADVHVRKMCLETAQILSTVMASKGIPLRAGMPKPYNKNHPVIKAIDTKEKLNWVLLYNVHLQAEYIFRFGKSHKYMCLTDNYINELYDYTSKCIITDYDFSKNFKEFKTNNIYVVDAYHEYYKFKKSKIKRWTYTKREEPFWLKDNL